MFEKFELRARIPPTLPSSPLPPLRRPGFPEARGSVCVVSTRKHDVAGYGNVISLESSRERRNGMTPIEAQPRYREHGSVQQSAGEAPRACSSERTITILGTLNPNHLLSSLGSVTCPASLRHMPPRFSFPFRPSCTSHRTRLCLVCPAPHDRPDSFQARRSPPGEP